MGALEFMATAFYILVGSVCVVAAMPVLLIGVLSVKTVIRNQKNK